MKVTWSLLLLAALCGECLANPAPTAAAASAHAVAPRALSRQRRESDFFGNTKKLIEELISNLHKAASQAKDAVVKFNHGLLEQAKCYREKFTQDLKKLQIKVSESIDSLQEKFVSSGSAVGECIKSQRGAVTAIYEEATQRMGECADGRLAGGSELVGGLSSLCELGQRLAQDTLEDMRNCSQQQSDSILGLGACLGALAIRTEVKGASFLMQSGLAIGRVNLFMSTLPAALEVCAGSSLVGAGAGTARLLLDIGSCSAQSVVSSFGAGAVAAAAGDAAVAGSNSVGAAAAAPAANIASAFSNGAAIAVDQVHHLAFV